MLLSFTSIQFDGYMLHRFRVFPVAPVLKTAALRQRSHSTLWDEITLNFFVLPGTFKMFKFEIVKSFFVAFFLWFSCD